MSRHTLNRRPFVAALAAIALAAGCGDSRTGGPDGMPAPGTRTTSSADQKAPDASSPKVPAEAGPASK